MSLLFSAGFELFKIAGLVYCGLWIQIFSAAAAISHATCLNLVSFPFELREYEFCVAKHLRFYWYSSWVQIAAIVGIGPCHSKAILQHTTAPSPAPVLA